MGHTVVGCILHKAAQRLNRHVRLELLTLPKGREGQSRCPQDECNNTFISEHMRVLSFAGNPPALICIYTAMDVQGPKSALIVSP